MTDSPSHQTTPTWMYPTATTNAERDPVFVQLPDGTVDAVSRADYQIKYGFKMTQETSSYQTTETPRQIARRHAQVAMAKIADAQMNTWTKFPALHTPTDFIQHAILQAMKDAGVQL